MEGQVLPTFSVDNHVIFEAIMMLAVALGGVYIRNILLVVSRSQADLRSELVSRQADGKAELLAHQNIIKEELTKFGTATAARLQEHVAEDALQFRFMADTLKRIEDNQRRPL